MGTTNTAAIALELDGGKVDVGKAEEVAKAKLIARLGVQQVITRTAAEFFSDKGFLELPPLMTAVCTDPLDGDIGSSVVGTPIIQYEGQNLVTTNSMILHKMSAVTDLGKPIFIISPNLRLERGERGGDGRHLFEFRQIDVEVPDASMEDIFWLVEGFIGELSTQLGKHNALFEPLGVTPFQFKFPFERYLTHKYDGVYGGWDIGEFEVPNVRHQPIWAICHHREFYEGDDPQHPGHFLNYDLDVPKYGEVLSGSVRENDCKAMLRKIKEHNIDTHAYRAFLRLAKRGLRRSAGFGIGVERLARFLTDTQDIGDMQLFRRVPGEKVIM
jgi:asparaginyl-tRNA synthetase